MNDPAKDGRSADHYSDYTSSMDVHYSSGIANLAFYLMAQGGTHPRGQTTIPVPALGMEKAIQVLYKANVDYLVPTSGFHAARIATLQAATDLGYTAAEIDAVEKAWAAVGVVSPYVESPASQGGSSIPRLQSGVAVSDLSSPAGGKLYYALSVPSGTTGLTFQIRGGSGNADLYVKHDAAPTGSSYDCRPRQTGNSETCTFQNPAPGMWYVMLDAAMAFSGVSLTGTATAGGRP